MPAAMQAGWPSSFSVATPSSRSAGALPDVTAFLSIRLARCRWTRGLHLVAQAGGSLSCATHPPPKGHVKKHWFGFYRHPMSPAGPKGEGWREPVLVPDLLVPERGHRSGLLGPFRVGTAEAACLRCISTLHVQDLMHKAKIFHVFHVFPPFVYHSLLPWPGASLVAK